MAIEAKEIIEFLGADPAKVDSIDKLRETFETSFIKRDPIVIKSDKELYGAVVGNTNGSVNTALRRLAKESGVELSEDDLKGKPAHEMVDIALPKILSPLTTKLKAAEENAGKGTDKKLTELQSAFDQYKAEVAPKLTGFDALQGEYETFKQSVAQEKTSTKINSYIEKERASYPRANGGSALAWKGFIAETEQEVKIELDDTGKEVLKRMNGELIPNPRVAGTYLTYPEYLVEKGKEWNKKGERIYAEAETPRTPAQPAQRGTFTVADNTSALPETTAAPGARRRIINTSTRAAV